MIFTGSYKNKNVVVVNPKQIIDLKLVKGRTKAYAKGDNDGDVISINTLTVVEPWSVRIRTAIDAYFINCNSLKEAIEYLATLIVKVSKTYDDSTLLQPDIKKELEMIYGKE